MGWTQFYFLDAGETKKWDGLTFLFMIQTQASFLFTGQVCFFISWVRPRNRFCRNGLIPKMHFDCIKLFHFAASGTAPKVDFSWNTPAAIPKFDSNTKYCKKKKCIIPGKNAEKHDVLLNRVWKLYTQGRKFCY